MLLNDRLHLRGKCNGLYKPGKCNPDGCLLGISVHGRFLGRHGGTAKRQTRDWGGTAGSPHAAVQFRTGPAALRPLPLMLERNWFSANLEGAVEDMVLWFSVLLVF